MGLENEIKYALASGKKSIPELRDMFNLNDEAPVERAIGNLQLSGDIEFLPEFKDVYTNDGLFSVAVYKLKTPKCY